MSEKTEKPEDVESVPQELSEEELAKVTGGTAANTAPKTTVGAGSAPNIDAGLKKAVDL